MTTSSSVLERLKPGMFVKELLVTGSCWPSEVTCMSCWTFPHCTHCGSGGSFCLCFCGFVFFRKNIPFYHNGSWETNIFLDSAFVSENSYQKKKLQSKPKTQKIMAERTINFPLLDRGLNKKLACKVRISGETPAWRVIIDSQAKEL